MFLFVFADFYQTAFINPCVSLTRSSTLHIPCIHSTGSLYLCIQLYKICGFALLTNFVPIWLDSLGGLIFEEISFALCNPRLCVSRGQCFVNYLLRHCVVHSGQHLPNCAQYSAQNFEWSFLVLALIHT